MGLSGATRGKQSRSMSTRLRLPSSRVHAWPKEMRQWRRWRGVVGPRRQSSEFIRKRPLTSAAASPPTVADNGRWFHPCAGIKGDVAASAAYRAESYVSSLKAKMTVNAAAPANDAPGAGDPALIKMSNQHTKLGQARSEEPAPTKLNHQDNTHAAPVCAP